MNKKIYTFLLVFLFYATNVYAAPNVKTEDTYDENTDSNKCPTSIIVQDNLKGEKDIDFSDLDCIYYKTDENGKFLLDENGEKILREEDEELDFSCLQSFLDKYTNSEFKEAANNKIAEGFPTNNKYCPVYCVEENEFVFPGYAPVINSGGHFTWTVENWEDRNTLDGLTVRLHGTKVCRAHVDLKQWVEDYTDLMDQIDDMIDERSPISMSNGTCTESADKVAPADGECGYKASPVKVTTVTMSLGESNSFREKFQSENHFYSTDDLTVSEHAYLTVLLPEGSYMNGTVKDLSNSSSNMFAFSYRVVSQNDKSSAFQNSQNSAVGRFQNGSLYVYDSNHPFGSFLEGNTGNVEYQFFTWERHCCEWVKEKEIGWLTSKSSPEAKVGEIPASPDYGYRYPESKSYCGNPGAGGHAPYNTKAGPCCTDAKPIYKTSCSCHGGTPGKNTAATCNGSWKCNTYISGYSCPSNPQTWYYNVRYVVKCGSNGTGNEQRVAATGEKQKCRYGSVPTCPSGYTYSSKGTCQKADTKGIVNTLIKIATLRTKLKQCHDQLIPYDYYLDTNMEIEYNETSDSAKNFYIPSKDKITNTKLEKVSENTPEEDNENILGKYSSEIIKPSKKSNYQYTGTFFGNHYLFSANSIPIPSCTLSGLTKLCGVAQTTEYTDYWYDWYGRTYVAIYEYKLDGNFYRWVKMPSGESISTKPTGDYLKYNRFIDIGYANYPVHFATPASKYEGLNIKITNIGAKNYLYNTYQTQIETYNSNLTDKDFVSTEQKNELLHDCYYEVTEGEPYCPTTGCGNDEYDLGSVRIIYRPISLENPFPDMDASGRDTGSNWCLINDEKTDCSNNNDNVEKYISNNRNTSGSDIYFEREPMYEITLTPSLIKSIREYNSTTDYDDYNLSCSGLKGEEGTKCRSNFVVDVPDIDLPSLRDYISGCGTEEWDACDKLDNYER